MIKRLKKKFVLLATVAMVILMFLLVGIMNAVNYSAVVTEADTVLDVLSQPGGPFGSPREIPARPLQDIGDFIPHGMSPEIPYESRYFTVMVSGSGSIEGTDISRIISVDEEAAGEYVREAFADGNSRGFIGQFRFLKQADGGMTKITFLDCGRKLDSFRIFMWTSISVGLLGCVLVFIVFLFASGRIVRPIAAAYEKQKRFITDAGHEIKTPLAIIGANLDLLESEYKDNEGLSDIRGQVERLKALTGDLVYLSKMEESEATLKKTAFPVSDLIMDTARQFCTLAEAGNRDYRIQIEPDLILHGSPDAIRQLMYILLDNAMKYSPESGNVLLDMHANKKQLHISVSNTTKERMDNENLNLLFDRFYRTDASRNSETGGHGIGLSIAQAIISAHNGRISAESGKGTDFKISITIPLQ